MIGTHLPINANARQLTCRHTCHIEPLSLVMIDTKFVIFMVMQSGGKHMTLSEMHNISRDDRVRNVTCSLQTATDRQTDRLEENFSIDIFA